MFKLQQLPQELPIEFDGHIHFTWLGAKTKVEIENPHRQAFLELRLGYPDSDPDKLLHLSGCCLANGQVSLPIIKGWHSYFVPIAKPSTYRLTITIDTSLIVPGEQRFLGVMLSYLAVTDDPKRAASNEDIMARLTKSIRTRQNNAAADHWPEQLSQSILESEDDFYTHHTPPVRNFVDLDHPVKKYTSVFTRHRWFSQRIPSKSLLLDVGSGLGSFYYLQQKGVTLVGVDLSLTNCRQSLAKGYLACPQANATALPFTDAVFDRIISSDVLGHIRPEDKPALIDEFHRVLKPNGRCLQVIETHDLDPSQIDPDDYAQMVLPDGHLGLVSRQENELLFSRRFTILESFLVGNVCRTVEQLIRSHDLYGANLPGQVLEFIINANKREREFFDLGAGWTFHNLLQEKYDSKAPGGLLFLYAQKKKHA